jgi:RluA family pseudouridine synthase
MRLLHSDLERGAAWARQRGVSYLANAHRLDFETSGVILLAKDKPTLTALADQFGSEKPKKVYAALVHSSPRDDTFEIVAKLAPHPVRIGEVRVDTKNGKKSQTAFRVRERFSGYSLLECRPRTGRTHQIRVHLKHAGFPVVGDALYGGRTLLLSMLKRSYRFKSDEPERPLIGRVALHAEQLEVQHPVTGEQVTISAPWPKDLTVAMRYLRRFTT